MSQSKGVVITRVIVAVVFLSLVFTCVYFFIIKAKDNASHADNKIFATVNTCLNSADIKTIDTNLGSFESGAYYDYAQSQGGLGFKEAYIEYYGARQMLDVYGFRLITSRGDTTGINNKVKEINQQAVVLLRSQEVYNTTREAYGDNPTTAERQALLTNFNVMTKDLKAYATDFYELASLVFDFTMSTYFEGLDRFGSAHYVYGYAFNTQLAVFNEAVQIDFTNINSTLYSDTKFMMLKLIEVASDNFSVETTDATVGVVLDYFKDDANGNFESLLKAKDKVDYVSKITDEAEKTKSTKVLEVLGFAGRLA